MRSAIKHSEGAESSPSAESPCLALPRPHELTDLGDLVATLGARFHAVLYLWWMSRPPEAELLDAARQLNRWSMARLSRESGLAMGTIQEALSGRRVRPTGVVDVRPSVGTLLVLARTLDWVCCTDR